MSSTPSLKHNDAKEHDSFLIIISNFFSPSFTFWSGPIFVHDFVLILFHSVFCLSCLTTHRYVHLLRSLLLYFPFVLSLSTQHQKVNILFRFRIPTSCHCYCEKKYSAFHFGSSFTFDFWMDQFQMFSILSSECRRREEGNNNNTRSWCWLKVGWMHWLLRYADEYISVLMVVSI